MEMSMEAQRALIILSQELPMIHMELEKLNRSMESINGLASLSSIPERITSTFRDLKALFTEIESDGMCENCDGRGWYFHKVDKNLSVERCALCGLLPTFVEANAAALEVLGKLGLVSSSIEYLERKQG